MQLINYKDERAGLDPRALQESISPLLPVIYFHLWSYPHGIDDAIQETADIYKKPE